MKGLSAGGRYASAEYGLIEPWTSAEGTDTALQRFWGGQLWFKNGVPRARSVQKSTI